MEAASVAVDDREVLGDHDTVEVVDAEAAPESDGLEEDDTLGE